MRTYFTIFRKAVATLSAALLLGIVCNVVGQFFINLAQDYGLYNTPSERVGHAMNAFASFMNQTWILIAATLLSGISIGFYIDIIFRKYERLKIFKENDTLTTFVIDPSTPAGVLDYLADGLQALDDIKTITEFMTKDTDSLTKLVNRYKIRIASSMGFDDRRNIARELANDFFLYSNKIKNNAGEFAKAAKSVESNCGEYIKIANEDESAFSKFYTVNEEGIRSTTGMISELCQAQQHVKSAFTGISRDLNAAVNKLSGGYDHLISELNDYCSILTGLGSACQIRIDKGKTINLQD